MPGLGAPQEARIHGGWGLCRKPKCPRPPVTHLPLSCSLGEAGGAGAEPPQNLPTAAAPVQTVLPLKWSGRKRGAGLSNPVPRFRRRNGNGKNPDSQGVRVDRRNGDRTGIVFIGDMCYTWVSKQTNKLELVRTGVYDEHDNMA